MKKELVLNSLKKMDSESKPRNFTQTIELIITFRNLEVNKPSGQFNIRADLPNPTGKESGKALLFAKTKTFIESIKDEFDKIILEEEIPKLKKKEIQSLLSYDVLLAEGPVVVSVAKHLGQELAPKGKMPKPLTDLRVEIIKNMLKQLKSSVNITNRKGKGIPMVQVIVGREDMENEKIADNILKVYNEVLHALPKQKHNIKATYIKKTMGPSIKIQEK